MPLSKTEFARIAARLGPGATDEQILEAARAEEQKKGGVIATVGGALRDTAKQKLDSVWNTVVDPVLKALSAPASAAAGAAEATLKGKDPFTVGKEALASGAKALVGETKSLDSALKAGGIRKPLPAKVEIAGGISGDQVRAALTDIIGDPLNALDLPLKGAAAGAVALKAAPKGMKALKQAALFEGMADDALRGADAIPGGAARKTNPPSALPARPEEVERLGAYHSPLPKYIREQFELGKEGADWYAQALPKIQTMLGDDAEKVIDYFAATSPNATVRANTGFAVKALEQDKAGLPFSGTMGQNITRLEKAKKGETFGGPKVRNFARALRGDKDAVVVDRWVARHWGLDKATDKQYAEIESQIKKHAKALGVEPRQLQAALWTSAKKLWGRPGDTAAPFEEVLEEMVAQRPLFNPEGLTKNSPAPGLAPVEDLFKGEALQRYANEIGAIHKANKGSTYNLKRGDLGGQEAFAVSVFPEREVVLPPGSKLGPKEVVGFIQKNQDLLRDPRVSFGSWEVDAADASERYPAGSIVLGISATPRDLTKARNLGRELGEEQIFDLKSFKTRPTWAKGKPGQLPELSKRLEGVDDTDPELLELEHRSKEMGLTRLDPTKFGSGESSAEFRRSKNYPGKFPPRSFFTRKGGEVEKQIQELPFVYDAAERIPRSRLYDLGQDPEGLITLAREHAEREWGDTSPAGVQTMLEKMLIDAGYSGMMNSKHGMKAMEDTVVLFEPMGVKQRGGNAPLQQGAEKFIEREALPKEPFAPRVEKLNPKNMAKVAKAFEALEHKPDSPEVRRAYQALKGEVKKQFDFITNDLGIKMEPWTQPGQPYANSKEMMEDVARNKRLFFFTGGDMPADHPLAEVEPSTGLTFNDLFRAVHDVFGHAKEGFQFGPVGEENAFREHARMFSSEARGALATETKGQNSWVNYGPKGARNRAKPGETQYAEQKAAILPEEFQKLSAIVGPVIAAGLMQRLQNRSEN